VCWFVTSALPLNAAPQFGQDAPGVSVDTAGAPLLHRAPVASPGSNTEGSVVVQVKLDDRGNVTDASVLSGPEELRKTVLQSVLNWHFANGAGGSVRQLTVNFKRPAVRGPAFMITATPGSEPPVLVKQIDIAGLPEATRQQVASSLPVHIGDSLTPQLRADTLAAARKLDEHVTLSVARETSGEAKLRLSVPGEAIGAPSPAAIPAATGNDSLRITGEVAQTKLITSVTPLYPPLAKAARVQGVVKLDAIIGKDGHVINLRLISGPPLLVFSAMEAVRQWIYQPTLLNGNPVEVVTTLDVNFTLSQ